MTREELRDLLSPFDLETYMIIEQPDKIRPPSLRAGRRRIVYFESQVNKLLDAFMLVQSQRNSQIMIGSARVRAEEIDILDAAARELLTK